MLYGIAETAFPTALPTAAIFLRNIPEGFSDFYKILQVNSSKKQKTVLLFRETLICL
jgi:zinc transporter ZupT